MWGKGSGYGGGLSFVVTPSGVDLLLIAAIGQFN
jgi:hypothetical protein